MPATRPPPARARPFSRGAPSSAADPRPPVPGDRPVLRLAVARGTLGIELDSPLALRPIVVREMEIALPGVRFPVDLSGGVARFRHRRGELVRLGVEARAVDLAMWAAPRLRGVIGDATPDVVIAPIEAGLLVGLRSGSAALAFDVVVAPIERDVALVPERARGIGLGAPPHALALRALVAMLGSNAKVTGGVCTIADVAGQIARSILPASGARAPSTSGVRVQVLETEIALLRMEASRDRSRPALSGRALSALELAEASGDADHAAFAGDLDRARRAYLDLLERMPRHPEIGRRLAWIDLAIGDRAEAALSTLSETASPAFAGTLGGELLAKIGDDDGAAAALSQAAHEEPYGPLAALSWLRVASLASELDARLDALDQAVVRAPAMEEARWARFDARLRAADLRAAMGEVEHLEAIARGAESKHEVWRRAADALLSRGLLADATALFERALRFSPESAEAVAGLARSMRATGQGARALDLFARALSLGERKGVALEGAVLDLARSLVEVAGDRPAAIARVRSVPALAPEGFEARLLEGRWRADLGDLAGAAQALGRLRDAVEIAEIDGDRAAAVASLLVEAASIDEREREDPVAAQRDLGLAMRLRPRDRRIAGEFRRVSSEIARRAPAARSVALPVEVSDTTPPPRELSITLDSSPPPAHDDERLVEELTHRVRADPGNHAIAMSLADALERLGRDLDLLALLSARMEEGDEGARAEVAPRRRAVLLRLANAARDAGRPAEAALYEDMAAGD